MGIPERIFVIHQHDLTGTRRVPQKRPSCSDGQRQLVHLGALADAGIAHQEIDRCRRDYFSLQ
jgi:hypothetical protein